mgnify:FL=1
MIQPPKILLKKLTKVVDGKRLAYLDEGQGDPIVLLHGNPTSSYLWRNVIPELAPLGRVIAPDLIGHGDSDKMPLSDGPGRYSFSGTYHYLTGLLHVLGVKDKVVMVGHDWGSVLAFHWARNHPNKVRGLVYMEALVMPLTWNDWPENARGIFQAFRSKKGEDLVLNRNLFIESVLPNSIIRELTQEEMDHYRSPFLSTEDRQVVLNWPRQIPIDGEPAIIEDLVSRYGAWLEKSNDVPKLFINADPGSILIGRQREYCRTWPNQEEVTVRGRHFLQEDSPVEVSEAIVRWLIRFR